MADTPTVDVNTDNLDDFATLFSGTATAEPAPEAAEAVEEEVIADDSSATDEAIETEAEPTGEDEEVETEEEDDVLTPKKKPNARDRINELTAEKYAEKRRADELERRLAALEAVKDKVEPQPVVKTEGPDPDATDNNGNLVYPLGEFDPKFISALQDYNFERKWEARQNQAKAEAEAAKQTEAETALIKNWETKLAKSEEGLEDLRPTIATLDTEFGNLEPEFGTYLAQTIMSMETGPEVLYYLANNLDEARKIVASGTREATLALGKIEARIESALSKKAAPTIRTKAPTPPVTTRGNSGRLSAAPDTDDLAAFESLFYKK